MKKFLNWFLIIALSLIIIIGGGYISYMLLFGGHSGHTNMSSSTQGPSNNAAAGEKSPHSAHSPSNSTAASEHSSHSTGYNLDISSESPTTNLTENTNLPPKKREPELNNVVFIDYIVNPTDTLWRISKIYMPDFSVLDTGDTMGIITYIAQTNKLKKGNNGEYMIYYGQKLKIPAELSVVSKVVNTTGSSKADSNSTNNTNYTTEITPKNSESLPSTHTDHSSHSGMH